MTRQTLPVLGRACNGCTLCCTLMSVEELDKAPATPCANCHGGIGCRIHADRPVECRGFFCDYLLDPVLGEEWRPSRCHMVISYEDYSQSLVIMVDADHETAWRAEPYHSQILEWARAGAERNHSVVVWQGETKLTIVAGAADAGDAADHKRADA